MLELKKNVEITGGGGLGRLKKDFWLMPPFAVIAFLFAAGLHKPLLWFLFHISALCIFLTLVYKWRKWTTINIERVINANQMVVEAGTNLKVILKLQVLGMLPWPWIEVKDVSPTLLIDDNTTRNFIWARKGNQMQAEYVIPNVRRGIHIWDAIEYKSGDPLGFLLYKGRVQKFDKLIVIPRTIDLPIGMFFSKTITGYTKAGKGFDYDRGNPMGIREYQPGDSLSHIAWKSTAKMGRLQSKEFEPLRSDFFNVVLDCSVDTWSKGYDPSFEEAVVAAASFVKTATIAHMPVTFYSNAKGHCRQLFVDKDNYNKYILQMAFIKADGIDSFADFLYRTILERNSNLVIVSSHRGIRFEKTLRQMSDGGRHINLILINKNIMDKKYSGIEKTGFYNRVIINKAEDLIRAIGKR